MQITGSENDSPIEAHAVNQEIGKQEMPEKIQLECSFESIFGKFQRLRSHVDAPCVEDQAA